MPDFFLVRRGADYPPGRLRKREPLSHPAVPPPCPHVPRLLAPNLPAASACSSVSPSASAGRTLVCGICSPHSSMRSSTP